MKTESSDVAGAGGRSYLQAGSRITGELQFPGTVELPGYVKGRVKASSIVIEETGEVEAETGGRPARLLRFRRDVLTERPAPGMRLPLSRRTA